MSFVYRYPRPAVVADVVVLRAGAASDEILLIERRHDPAAGAWALPGGHLEPDEDLASCARRELREETGVSATDLQLIGAFSAPARIVGDRVVSIAYLTVVPANTQTAAGDDACTASWFALTALPDLAFDHRQIVAAALAALPNGQISSRGSSSPRND